MLLPAVNNFLCCKDNVGLTSVQYLLSKLVANGLKVMVNDKIRVFQYAFKKRFCFLFVF